MNKKQWIVITMGLLTMWSTNAVSPAPPGQVGVREEAPCSLTEKAASHAILQSLMWYGFLFTEQEKIKQEEYAADLVREKTDDARSGLYRQRIAFWVEKENEAKKQAEEVLKKRNKTDAFLKSEHLWARYEEAVLCSLARTSATSRKENSPRFLLVNEHLKRSHCTILRGLCGSKSLPVFPDDLPESSQNIKLMAALLLDQTKKDLSVADFDLWCKEMKKLLPAWSDYMEFVVDIHPDSSEFTDAFCLEMRVLLKSLLISGKKG